MMQRKLILVGWIALSAVCSCWAAAVGRYPITNAQVSAAIDSTGTPVTPEQVTLLSDVVSSTPAPQLRIQTVERTNNEQLMVRVACETPEQCLPFMVTLHANLETAAHLQGLYASTSPSRMTAAAPGQVVIRNGAQAVLLLDGKHVHIKIPVITLENGSIGQRIRVAEKDSRLTYMAVVVNSGVLQGRL